MAGNTAHKMAENHRIKTARDGCARDDIHEPLSQKLQHRRCLLRSEIGLWVPYHEPRAEMVAPRKARTNGI
jgi:hypothetical protein